MQLRGRMAQSLVEKGIGVMIAMVVIGAVGIPVVQDSLVTERVSVTNETVSSSGSLPEVLSLNDDESGIEEGSVTVFLKDNNGGGTPVTFKLQDGNFTILDDDPDRTDHLNMTGPFTRINETSDQYNVSYNGEPQGFIDSSIARTIVDFLVVILALVLFIAAISMVQ